VFWIGGDDEFVTSGYRDLQRESKTQKRKEVRQSGWAKLLGREWKGQTSMPSLIRPVLISGPFYRAVIQ